VTTTDAQRTQWKQGGGLWPHWTIRAIDPKGAKPLWLEPADYPAEPRFFKPMHDMRARSNSGR